MSGNEKEDGMRWNVRAGKNGTHVESVVERLAVDVDTQWVDVRTEDGNEYRLIVSRRKRDVGVNVYKREGDNLVPCPEGTWS